MKTAIKSAIRDTRSEPAMRWLVKRLRGLRMPYDLVKNEIYDRQAVDVMDRVLTQTSNCIDIGAHRGQFLRDFLRLSPRGRHLAFEPIPELARGLREAFDSVEVLEVALSDREGAVSFYVLPDAPALSGLNDRPFLRPGEARREIQVRTARLDDIVPLDRRIDFIKIDVEGAEGLVIAGALETIRRCKPYIVMEHGRRSCAAFGTTPEQIHRMLTEDCGLRVSLLSDWLHRGHPLSEREFASSREWYFLAHPVER